MRDTVSGEQVARSATCATLKLRRKRASFICSPTTCIFCSNFRGNLVPIVLFAITSTYHIICKDNTFSLFYDRLIEIIYECNYKEIFDIITIITSKKNRNRSTSIAVCSWCHRESNQGHKDFQSFALPTELWHRFRLGLQR